MNKTKSSGKPYKPRTQPAHEWSGPTSVAELIDCAIYNDDDDPVSTYMIGDDIDSSDCAVMVITGNDAVARVDTWLRDESLVTEERDWTDGRHEDHPTVERLVQALQIARNACVAVFPSKDDQAAVFDDLSSMLKEIIEASGGQVSDDFDVNFKTRIAALRR